MVAYKHSKFGEDAKVDIRSELEHANYKVYDKGALTQQVIDDLSKEYSILLVCDVAKREDGQDRETFVKSIAKAGIISDEQVDAVMADESLEIVVPLHTEQIAMDLYRKIPHASHFVTIWMDGKEYRGAC